MLANNMFKRASNLQGNLLRIFAPGSFWLPGHVAVKSVQITV